MISVRLCDDASRAAPPRSRAAHAWRLTAFLSPPPCFPACFSSIDFGDGGVGLASGGGPGRGRRAGAGGGRRRHRLRASQEPGAHRLLQHRCGEARRRERGAGRPSEPPPRASAQAVSCPLPPRSWAGPAGLSALIETRKKRLQSLHVQGKATSG